MKQVKFGVCRVCGAALKHTAADLGLSPLANSYVTPEKSREGEVFYPLHVFVCDQCYLVQLEEFESPENIFSDYAYFSGYSTSWLRHAENYVAKLQARFGLSTEHKVVEVASNDGYLLQYFVERKIPVLGVEPARNVAETAISRGVPTEIDFFGRATAERLRSEGHCADLMTANNVLAHVPDILDFVAGFRILLNPNGVATFEFPHLLRMVDECQFDTIYHEHFSYLSLNIVSRVAELSGLRVFDVEELPTHGGSLRVFMCHVDAAHHRQPAVLQVLESEAAAGLRDLSTYARFSENISRIKFESLGFLVRARQEKKLVCAYGAAAKGNTFLNYCGVGRDLVQVVADRSPHKQNALLPGSRIPVVSPEEMLALKPAYILILPWNLREEIAEQLSDIRNWGGSFVTAIPEIRKF
jgi:SAM-dependent methyltransferase